MRSGFVGGERKEVHPRDDRGGVPRDWHSCFGVCATGCDVRAELIRLEDVGVLDGGWARVVNDWDTI